MLVEKYTKPRHQFVDIERMMVGVKYAFTINASDDSSIYPTMFERYENAMLNLYKAGLYYDLYPEYSNSMKLHFHGYVWFKDYKKLIPIFKILNDLKNSFTYTMKEIHDYQWHVYCLKSRHIMQPWSKKQLRPYRLKIPLKKDFTCFPVDIKSQFLGLD